MGQAKKRGPFEVRKQQAIAAREAEYAAYKAEQQRIEEERRAAAQAKWDAMSEDERNAVKTTAARRHTGRLPIGAMAILPLLMLAGCGGGMMPNIRARR